NPRCAVGLKRKRENRAPLPEIRCVDHSHSLRAQRVETGPSADPEVSLAIFAQRTDPIMRQTVGAGKMQRGSPRLKKEKSVVQCANQQTAAGCFQQRRHRCLGPCTIGYLLLPASLPELLEPSIRYRPEPSISSWQNALIKSGIVRRAKAAQRRLTSLQNRHQPVGGHPKLAIPSAA